MAPRGAARRVGPAAAAGDPSWTPCCCAPRCSRWPGPTCSRPAAVAGVRCVVAQVPKPRVGRRRSGRGGRRLPADPRRPGLRRLPSRPRARRRLPRDPVERGAGRCTPRSPGHRGVGRVAGRAGAALARGGRCRARADGAGRGRDRLRPGCTRIATRPTRTSAPSISTAVATRSASSCSSASPSVPSWPVTWRARRGPGARSSTAAAVAARSSAWPRPRTGSAACWRFAAATSGRSPPGSPAADGYDACGRREDAAPTQLVVADPAAGDGALQPGAGIDRVARSPRLAPTRRSSRGPLPGRCRVRSSASSGAPRRRSASCRRRLPESLAVGHTLTAAGAYQALAVVYAEHGRPRTGASRRTRLRSTTARPPAWPAPGAACQACLCHVLRQRGEWRRSLELCRSLLDDPATDAASCAIACRRDEPDPRQPRRAPAGPPPAAGGRPGRAADVGARRRRRVPVDAGAPRAAGGRSRGRGRAVPRAAAALGDHRGPPLQPERPRLDGRLCLPPRTASADDLQRCVRALSTIAAGNGNREALALLAGAIGERALFDGAPAVAVEHFQRAIDLHATSSCRTTGPSCSCARRRPRAPRAATTWPATWLDEARLRRAAPRGAARCRRLAERAARRPGRRQARRWAARA